MPFAVGAKTPAPAITLSILGCKKRNNLQQQLLHSTPSEIAISIIFLASSNISRCFKLTFGFTIGLRHLPHMPVPAAYISSVQIFTASITSSRNLVPSPLFTNIKSTLQQPNAYFLTPC